MNKSFVSVSSEGGEMSPLKVHQTPRQQTLHEQNSNGTPTSHSNAPGLDSVFSFQSRFSIFNGKGSNNDDSPDNENLRQNDNGGLLSSNQDQSNLNYSPGIQRTSSSSPTGSNSSDSNPRENSIFDNFQSGLDSNVTSNGNSFVSSPTRTLPKINNTLSPNHLLPLGSPSRDLSFSSTSDPNRSPLHQTGMWNEQYPSSQSQPKSRISGLRESQGNIQGLNSVRQLSDQFEMMTFGIPGQGYYDMIPTRNVATVPYFTPHSQMQMHANFSNHFLQHPATGYGDLSNYQDRLGAGPGRFTTYGDVGSMGNTHGPNLSSILVHPQPNGGSAHSSPLPMQMPLSSPTPQSPTLPFDAMSGSHKSPGKRNSQSTPSAKILTYSSVKDVQGRIYESAKDQNGCRFLQRKLEEKDPKEIELIFEEVFPHITELMTDPFGNYLCQKLVEHCNDVQKTGIIKAVSNDLVKISTNMHGTRAVQKLIECLTTPKQIKLVTRSLKSHVVALIKDLNGNHVIQKCLQKLSAKDKQFIYDAVAGRCVEVATHKHGCCVLQRCVDFAAPDQKDLLNKEIIHHALSLVQNPFGNYVVQYILDLGDAEVNNQVIRKFLGSIYVLSTNKFSSNVIEKCLRISNSLTRQEMVNELASLQGLNTVLQDSYGNYVIQTALTVADPQQFEELSRVLKPQLPLIKNTPFGKKIENRLNKQRSSRARAQRNAQKNQANGQKSRGTNSQREESGQ